jgi:transposase
LKKHKKYAINYSVDILNEKRVKTQKIKGVRYVYRDTPYWDSEKKQNRHRREYIGKLDEDGTFVPSKTFMCRQVENEMRDDKLGKPSSFASRSFYGATHLLDCIGKTTGLSQDLENVFGKEEAQKIASLAYFLVLENESSMYRFDKFAKTHSHPYGKSISSQRISDLFASISEDEKFLFFKLRAQHCLKEEYLAYDTTSISSYSEMMNMVKYGKNKDLDDLPQINLALAFGEKSLTPVYYRKLPGNIGDVSTIEKLLSDMDFIGINKAKFVLDRGFYSKSNIDSLFRKKHKFVVAGRANTNLYKDFMTEIRECIKGFANYSEKHGVYTIQKKTTWAYEYTNKKGIKCSKNKIIYLFGFYDGERAEREKTEFIKKLKKAESAFIGEDLTKSQHEIIKLYFFTNETPNGTIISGYNQDAIDLHMKTFGYFMLLSNHIRDADLALEIYRNKDVVEKAFCNIKHRLDMKRTKVSSEESLEGKLFVQFVALAYVSYIHQVMASNDLYNNYSMSSLLDELDVIEMFRYQGKKIHLSEITKKQMDIFDAFGVSPQTTL